MNDRLLPPKVFGVGFQKTGTSSLGRALEPLGHRVIAGGLKVGRPITEDTILKNVARTLEESDAVEDTPWPFQPAMKTSIWTSICATTRR